MNVLITYDVSTETAAGRKRLRKVALTCLDFGQRVQKSVFECSVSEIQYEEVVRRLLNIIDEKKDSLRVYRLIEPKEKYVKVYGVNTSVDFEEPLVL
ncbi:CRISPR-associated endonuclease Cas2 [Candidatus Nitrospira inopinata]|jgi:CRISPR-associated protein Cas2|uniref:CRISPR-associated endoribonuclease Cas2 n=1 Tax=Candidatus Nitrospira inopinata TaxID=1715989 RepID=A0A0S4KYV3_9BACT|nr:CRISPR-associated endonuclease Cas2 [Candidatus Nitrospira inopinata]CUQ67556.1 CRISPR-associated endoribonuclease Cas2 1 [Candidatus Nitrospira inopinata]